MPRYRVFYEKRGPACFIPHVALPTVFARAASRACYFESDERNGLEPIVFQMTEGFSPHAKMSFASELPVGVVALNDPADVWLLNSLSDSQFLAWSMSLPTGFKLNDFFEAPEGSPSLSKSCPVSDYLLKPRSIDKMEEVKKTLVNMIGDIIIDCNYEGEFLRFTVNNSVATLGTIVKKFISENTVEGWHELCIIRTRVGGKDNER